MYLSAFNSRGYFPLNTKWAGSSRLSGLSRRGVGMSAGPFYGTTRRRRRLGQDDGSLGPDFQTPIDYGYSPLPDLTAPIDTSSTPLILIPSSAGDTTPSILPSTLTPPPAATAAQPPLNLAPSLATAAPTIASALQKIFTPAPPRPGVAPVAAASILPGVSGTTLLLWGGGALLLIGAMGRRK